MTVYFENETGYQADFDPEKHAQFVISSALDLMKFPYEAEVSLTLIDDENIRELNQQFRSIDRSTDVLSFPLIDYETAGDYDALETSEDYFNPESGEAMLGDIVISVPTMQRQAVEYGHSERREYSFLIVHSILHLLGFDHIEEADRLLMEEKQEFILNTINITRN